ncbi:unnamed protein product [Brassicogethes aeneus]|uniref:Sterile alpha motif domain-containing protein 5 n=1 Tax=Brassicogethes aeneus TaxID=1431903 RepID=A0A9P0AZT5_BRAAE|nr:unnamed protein product [Brassicogethes aeneus]
MASNIVAEWLRSLQLSQYAESFVDNGYDDLEICKQVGDPDLDAIGVINPVHRVRLLQSVRSLREEGAASVYFTLEESVAVLQECLCGQVKCTCSSANGLEKEATPSPSSGVVVASSIDNAPDNVVKYLDEYEEGKAELVKIPRIQLKILLRQKLKHDGIRLGCQPYSTPEGNPGYIEGLASRYADLFNTHYGDILAHLEYLRLLEWTKSSPKEEIVNSPSTQKLPIYNSSDENEIVSAGQGIPSSQSQPLYVPGKYLPSSCITDKDEDEIYGFAYGVYSAQIAKQQQQKLLGSVAIINQQPTEIQQQHNFQTCLSPRSAYFYEFPPNERNCMNTGKRKTTFSRILQSFKTSHRKEKNRTVREVPQRVDTPDSVLQSGLEVNDHGQHVLRSMVDPCDYDRLRNLQLNGETPNTFEETIYKLKLQEALRKREKFTKDHEDILRDIKQGLIKMEKKDDTYMYDEDAKMLLPAESNNDRVHWYDEPPYESDPEDFLMGSSTGPTATIQNGLVCFTLNLRQNPLEGGVMSTRSAGDISLARGAQNIARVCREEPPCNEVQSMSSRLSNLSVETTRSGQEESQLNSPQYQTFLEDINPSYRKPTFYDGSIISQQSATIHVRSDGRCAGMSAIVGKVKNLKNDVQRTIMKLKGETREQSTELTIPCSTSSIESIPSGSGSSTQALVREDSNQSSMSAEDDLNYEPIIARAKALIDHNPNPYDKEALQFKAGDIIDITSMNAGGQWRGICNGKKGIFKFINVEILSNRNLNSKRAIKLHRNIKGKPTSVEDLLQKLNLQEYMSVFILNGYEDLELFKEIEATDLDYLGIINVDHRSKILTAVQVLHDLDSQSEEDMSEPIKECEYVNKEYNVKLSETCVSFKRGQHFRDSGCYDASVKNATLHQSSSQVESDLSDNNVAYCDKNNLDLVVKQCNNEILARVKRNQNSHPLEDELSTSSIKYSTSTIDIHKKYNVSENVAVESCQKNVLNKPINQKTNETEQNISLVKPLESNILAKHCLSENSSDSGVSSSSFTSGNIKDFRQTVLSQHLVHNSLRREAFNSANYLSTTANREK